MSAITLQGPTEFQCPSARNYPLTLKEWFDIKIEDGDINSFEYDDFSNIEKAGEGAFGIVNKADWNDSGIKVALKSSLNNSTIDENQKDNFLKEVNK